jgi:hypothetical protein
MTMTATVVMETLTDSERAEFVELEETIMAGLQVYYKVGAALLRIREARLYRADYGNFEAYCIDRWSMGRRRANQLIAASEIITYSQGTIVPLNEAQARPLTMLEPENMATVWQVVKDTAPNGVVTSGHVQSVCEVFKEAIDTGAVDNGEGESIHVSDLAKALISEQTYERMQRQNAYIETASQNASQTRHKGQGTILAMGHGDLHIKLETGVLDDIYALIGKKVVITIREATE